MLRNHAQIVGVVGGVERHHGVVVDEVVEPARPHNKRGDDPLRMQALAAAGDHARLDKIDDAFREHLGVDPQISVIEKLLQHRVRNGSDAQLQRGAVIDQRDHLRGDALMDFGNRCAVHFNDRAVCLDMGIDDAPVDEGLTEAAGHLLVDLRNHVGCGGRGGLGDVHGNAEGAEAVRVWWRHMDQGDIQREDAVLK